MMSYPVAQGEAQDAAYAGEVDVVRDEHWVTVQEAARRLGVKDDAIRKRIQRGTLRSEKDPEDGRVYVYLDTTQDTTQDASYDGTQDKTYDAAEDASWEAVVLVEEMRGRIASLERMLDEEREARTEERRRHDTLMATLMQRIPELEAPQEPRDASETASPRSDRGTTPEDSEEPTQRRSWLYRFFFGP
jgi:excisionase family DNA binding protein